MIDEVFRKIVKSGLCDWGVLLLGISEIPGTSERLSFPSIASFANEQLEDIPISDPCLDLIVELATSEEPSRPELREILERLCNKYAIDLDRSMRIWRCFFLDARLEECDTDSVYGLLGLSEFWSQWGWPDDSPASMRNSNEKCSTEYHSDSHYNLVIEEHRAWLQMEKSYLRGESEPISRL